MPLSEVRSISSARGLFGASISITTSTATTKYPCLAPKEAGRFVASVLDEVKQRLSRRCGDHLRKLQVWSVALDQLLAGSRYVANFDLEAWRSKGNLRSALEAAATVTSDPLLREEAKCADLRRIVERLEGVASGACEEVVARNARFVDAELMKHRAFFDAIELKPLTQEQRVAAVVLQDRNLLVAAAGSGKTSTIVAKAGYALLTKQYQPSELLVLAFNNDAAKELDQRINSQLAALLPGNAKVRCSTFHALGLAVIANGRGVKPSVASIATGSEAATTRFMEELIDELLRTDQEFAVSWLTFRALYGMAAKPIDEFQSRRDWDQYVRAVGDFRGGRRGFLTLNQDLVKSQGELAIANWLFVQGIPYEYERAYEHSTATEHYRQYAPDFFFPEIGAYLEHYAVDAKGNVPAAFADRYRKSMQWKAALHAHHQTDLITTTFGEFMAGTLFPKLREELKKKRAEV